MSSPLTVGERILLHLARFSKFQENYDVPPDVSQDGIASALRISRAHAAIELKKLKENSEVNERLAHIKGGKSRRKVYFLTPDGEERARQIREYAEREGIEIAPLLDLRRCDPEDLWNSLNNDMREILGKASVFRRPFKREILPSTSIPLLPEDKNGMVVMPEGLREAIPSLIPEEDLRSYHSFAADYWLYQGDYRERLYHLLRAGRCKEAEILLAMRRSTFLENPDRDILEIVFELKEVSDKYAEKINRLKAELALALGDEKRCLEVLEKMKDSTRVSEQLEAIRIEGNLLLQKGALEEAFNVFQKGKSMVGNGINIPLECDLARALIEMGKHEESREILESLIPLCSENANGDLIGHIHYLLGMNSMASGNYQDAVKYLSKGLSMVKNEERDRWYAALSDAFMRLGMKEQAERWLAKIPRAKRSGTGVTYLYR